MEAGAIAGLAVERIMNEPTAAALAYGYGQDDDRHLRVLVYDLGGGTFDVSLIELHYGVVDVLATAGDNHLGGDDFDERLANLLADEFAEEHSIDLRQDHQAWARLLRDARVQAAAIDRVLLVGGSTRIPAVWELVSEHMEQSPHDEIDPDAVVALGAAVQAGIIAGDAIDAVLVDVTT